MTTGFKSKDKKDFDELFEPIEEGGGNSQTFRMYTKEGKDIGELFSPASQGEPADPVGFLKAGKDIGPLLCKKGSSNALPYRWATTTVTGTVQQNTYKVSDTSGTHDETFYGIPVDQSLTSSDGTVVSVQCVGSSSKSASQVLTVYNPSGNAPVIPHDKLQVVYIKKVNDSGVCVMSPESNWGTNTASFLSNNIITTAKAFTEEDVGKTYTVEIGIAPIGQLYDKYIGSFTGSNSSVALNPPAQCSPAGYSKTISTVEDGSLVEKDNPRYREILPSITFDRIECVKDYNYIRPNIVSTTNMEYGEIGLFYNYSNGVRALSALLSAVADTPNTYQAQASSDLTVTHMNTLYLLNPKRVFSYVK